MSSAGTVKGDAGMLGIFGENSFAAVAAAVEAGAALGGSADGPFSDLEGVDRGVLIGVDGLLFGAFSTDSLDFSFSGPSLSECWRSKL